MTRAVKRSNWMHCPECDHRMFWNKGEAFDIEIKCPSCKRIIHFESDGTVYRREVAKERQVSGNVQKQSV